MREGLVLRFCCAEGDFEASLPRGKAKTILWMMDSLKEGEPAKEYVLNKSLCALVSQTSVQFFLGDFSSEFYLFVERPELLEAITSGR